MARLCFTILELQKIYDPDQSNMKIFDEKTLLFQIIL